MELSVTRRLCPPSPSSPPDHPWSFPQVPQSRARGFILSSFLFIRSFFSILVLPPGEVHLDSHSWFPKCALWSLSVLHIRSKWKFGVQRVFLKAIPWLILCGYECASLRVVYLPSSRMEPESRTGAVWFMYFQTMTRKKSRNIRGFQWISPLFFWFSVHSGPYFLVLLSLFLLAIVFLFLFCS